MSRTVSLRRRLVRRRLDSTRTIWYQRRVVRGRRHIALRAVALMLATIFLCSGLHVANAATWSCAGRCPANCPMHVKDGGCDHNTPGVHTRPADHCHRARKATGGIRNAGCKQRPDGFTKDQPVVMQAPHERGRTPLTYAPVAPRAMALPEVDLDPPFHPPRPVSSSI